MSAARLALVYEGPLAIVHALLFKLLEQQEGALRLPCSL